MVERSRKIEKPVIISNSEYNTMKRKIVEYEKTNFDTIALIPSRGQGDWKKMGDNSALVYYYFVVKPQNATVAFRDDTDDYNRFTVGTISANGIASVRRRIVRQNLYKGEKVSRGRVIFELNRSFDPAELEELKKSELKRRADLNRIIKVQTVSPTLSQRLNAAALEIHTAAANKLRHFERDTNGVAFVLAFDNVLRDFYSTPMLPPAELPAVWRRMRADMDKVMIELQVISTARIWSVEKCARLGKDLITISDLIEAELARDSTPSAGLSQEELVD